MSEVFSQIGMIGTIQRPVYDLTTGEASGTTYELKMGLVREAFVKDLESTFKTQRFGVFIPKKLLLAAGWPHGEPGPRDVVRLDGQTIMLEHVLRRGYAEDLIYYCQSDG